MEKGEELEGREQRIMRRNQRMGAVSDDVGQQATSEARCLNFRETILLKINYLSSLFPPRMIIGGFRQLLSIIDNSNKQETVAHAISTHHRAF